jgi:hypothetical protein
MSKFSLDDFLKSLPDDFSERLKRKPEDVACDNPYLSVNSHEPLIGGITNMGFLPDTGFLKTNESFWPPIPGLLCVESWQFKERDEWSIEDWKAYALFLVRTGADVVRELNKTKRELTEQRQKASRKKTSRKSKPIRGLLLIYEEPKTKRGPKKKENLRSMEYARLALEKRSTGQFKNNWDALSSVYDDLNLSVRKGDRPNKIQSRNVLNYMSDLKKSE